MTAAEVAAAGPTLTVGASKALFKTRPAAGGEYVFRPTADAQRFLVVETVEGEIARPLTVVLGWQAALRK